MSQFRFTRMESFPPVIKNIIIINALVFVAQLIFEDRYGITAKLGLWPIQSEHFHPYQVFTHLFTHDPNNFFHILFNMFGLWMFGRILESVWGSQRFLLFYIICGIGAAAAHMAVDYFQYQHVVQQIRFFENAGMTDAVNLLRNREYYAVGASGAVMGVMVAFAFLFPNTELFIMFIPFPIRAKWAILGMVALDLFGGIHPGANDNIAHFAHLGGAVTGFILVWIWNKTNRRSLY